MTRGRFASAISEHPLPVHAVGEVAGELLEAMAGAPIDLLVVFVSPHFAGATEDVAGVLASVLDPGAMIGATHAAVVGIGREVEGTPALSVWAASLPETEVRSVCLDAMPGEGGADLIGWPTDLDEVHTVVLLADPFTFPAADAIAAIGRSHPDIRIVGGLASAARGPGGNRLVGENGVVARGAVAALLQGGSPPEVVVSQGCRPVGAPFVVTAAEGRQVIALGGQPALDRLRELAETMDEVEREQLQQGLHLGVVVNEHQAEFGRGDFLVRNVVGARHDDGALAVAASVAVGQTVQFHVRDAAAADADLRALLAGRSASGALLFTCTGRGRRLFLRPDHDATAVGDFLGPVPLAGAFCAGEVGPVGGANHLHGFTACVVLF